MQTRVLDGVIRSSAEPLRLTPANESSAVMRPLPLTGKERTKKHSLDGMKVPQARISRAFTTNAPTQASPSPAKPQTPPVTPAADIHEVIELSQDDLNRKAGIKFTQAIMAALAIPIVLISSFGGYKVLSETKVIETPPAAIATAASTKNQATLAAMPAQEEGDLQEDQKELQALLDKFAASQPASFGIVVKDLETGVTASINAETSLTSASLYKLFVASSVYKMAEEGKINLDAPVSGKTGRTVRQCLKIMINISDNPCGVALGKKIGWSKQNAALKEQGYTGTTLQTPQKTSAHDVALLLERLYNKTLLTGDNNAELTQYMKEQRIRNRLPQGLPEGTVIAHKTADLYGYVHDAGIVYGPEKDYLIVVTSGPWKAPGHAAASIKQLSSQVYAHLNSQP